MKRIVILVGLAALAPSLLSAQKSKINEGYALYAANKPDGAAKALKEGLNDTTGLKPRDLAKAYTRLAQSLMKVVDISRVKTDLLQAFPTLELDAYQAIKGARRNDLDGKFDAEIKQAYPEVANALAARGDRAWKAKEYKTCATHLDAALDVMSLMDQNTVRSYIPSILQLKAYAYLSAGDTTRAINDFMTYTRTAPDTLKDLPGMYQNLIFLVRNAEKNEAKAISILEEARRKFPDDTDLRRQELDIYQNNPDLRDQALAKFKTAYDNAPNDVYVAINYATMLDQAGKNVDALPIYDKLKGLSDESWKAYPESRWIPFYNSAAFHVNRAKELIDAANDAADKKKMDGKAYEAEREKMKEILKVALPDLERAHELDPKNGDVISALVQVCMRLDDTEKAEVYIKKRKALSGEQ